MRGGAREGALSPSAERRLQAKTGGSAVRLSERVARVYGPPRFRLQPKAARSAA